jgi:hypothetical protein
MTDPIPVRIPALAYLSEPEEGVVYLNLQFNEPGITRGVGPFERILLSHNQLRNIATDAVVMALKSTAPN